MESETKVHQMISIKLKNIDTDEALIATALMAAPKKRSKCKVIGYNMVICDA
jgi:hypothetical protein